MVFKGNFHLPEKKKHLYEIPKSPLLLAKWNIHTLYEERLLFGFGQFE